jgi:hypothetical protein
MIRKGRRAIKCIHFIREEKVSQREGKWDKKGTQLAWKREIIVKSLNVLNTSNNSCQGTGSGIIGAGEKCFTTAIYLCYVI